MAVKQRVVGQVKILGQNKLLTQRRFRFFQQSTLVIRTAASCSQVETFWKDIYQYYSSYRLSSKTYFESFCGRVRKPELMRQQTVTAENRSWCPKECLELYCSRSEWMIVTTSIWPELSSFDRIRCSQFQIDLSWSVPWFSLSTEICPIPRPTDR